MRLALSFFYIAVFGAIGISLPFWPLWLSFKGLTPAETGMVMACLIAAKVLANPITGHIADNGMEKKRLMLILSLGSVLAYAFFLKVEGFYNLLLLNFCAGAIMSGIIPLGEGLVLKQTHLYRFDYGRIRLWGSISFIVVSTSVGWLLNQQSPALIPQLMLGMVFLVFVACLFLPKEKRSLIESPISLKELIKSPYFQKLVGFSACNQIAHSAYYGFATLYWVSQNHSKTTIGLLWAEGVVAEVVFFWFAASLQSRLSAPGFMAIAALGGIIRWFILGYSAEIGWLITAQLLHALTFGAAHLGVMHYLREKIPEGLASRAQGVHSSLSMGIAPALGVFLAGNLYQHLVNQAFWAMSLFSALAFFMALLLLKQERS